MKKAHSLKDKWMSLDHKYKLTLTEYILIIFIVTVFIFQDSVESNNIYRVFFMLFLLAAILKVIKDGKVYLQIYFWLALSFFGYCFLSLLWIPPNAESFAYDNAKVLIYLMVMYTAIYHVLYKDKNVEVVIRALLIAGMALSVYSLFYYGATEIFEAMISGRRLGNEFSQQNVFGMNLAITVVLCGYYWIYRKRKYMMILAIWPFILVMASGSRKALLIVVLGLMLLFLIKSGVRRIYKFIIVGAIIIAASYFIVQLPIFSMINERLEGLTAYVTGEGEIDSSTATRSQLIDIGIELIKERPIFGYGLNSFRVLVIPIMGHDIYSHNNLIELLVSGGIIAFALYYLMFAYILIKLWPLVVKRYPEAVAIFILILLRLIMDFGSVSYDTKLVWICLVAGFLTIKKYRVNEVEGKI